MWAELDDYVERIDEARDNIQRALELYEKPYVSFSGGKDSTVMLHMVLEHCPDVMTFHWDYGPYYVPRELMHEILIQAKQLGSKNTRVETSPEYSRKKRQAVSVLGKSLYARVTPLLHKDGYDLCFLGLRAGESKKRAARTKNLFEKERQMTNCFPVRHLSTSDIWAYIVSNELPYCSHYEKYAELKGLENVRMVTYFDPEFEHLGNQYSDGVLMPEFRNVR